MLLLCYVFGSSKLSHGDKVFLGMLAICAAVPDYLIEHVPEVFASGELCRFVGRSNSSQTSTLCISRHSALRGIVVISPMPSAP